MRRLILQMQMSLDGFAGGPNGELDWIFPGFGSDATGWIVDRLWQAGAHLMGGATYRDMAAHWPTSSEPAAAPMNQTPKLVLSRSLRDAPWGETRIVAGDVALSVAKAAMPPASIKPYTRPSAAVMPLVFFLKARPRMARSSRVFTPHYFSLRWWRVRWCIR